MARNQRMGKKVTQKAERRLQGHFLEVGHQHPPSRLCSGGEGDPWRGGAASCVQEVSPKEVVLPRPRPQSLDSSTGSVCPTVWVTV